MERLFDWQTLVVVDGFGAFGGDGWHTEVVVLRPHVERLGGEAGLVQHGGDGTPVRSLALRIMPSSAREGLGPLPLKYSKNVASLPKHSLTVRAPRRGKHRNLVEVEGKRNLDLADNFQSPRSALHYRKFSHSCWPAPTILRSRL
jgi:hypothetical protein